MPDREPRLAKHAERFRDEEVPLHDDGHQELVVRAVARQIAIVLPPAKVTVAAPIQPETDCHAVVDTRDESVVHEGNRRAQTEPQAGPIVPVVAPVISPPQVCVRLELDRISGMRTRLLDLRLGARRDEQHG